jgi:Mg-chelatase subunit ChlD
MYAQDLTLSQNDLRIELRADGSLDLFIRYKPDISSVLLTETTRDPQFRADNYAYRAAEWNHVNGDEMRLINGYPISKENNIFSLVSSTPKLHPIMGWAYQIHIPDTLIYGYEGGRHGEVRVGDGTYLNIRTFYYAYADYRGPFLDNPFILRLSQDTPPPELKGSYMRETVAAFTEIAGDNTVYSSGPSDLVDRIADILRNERGNDIDLVICFDTTGSMKPHLDAVRTRLIRMLKEAIPSYSSFRIGMVLYKDYREEYLTKIIPFTSDFESFQKSLDAIRASGGGDIPEAVHEALHEGATKFEWAAPSKIMILIGDAPPHPRPRGRITKQMVDREVASRGIKMNAIILPQ